MADDEQKIKFDVGVPGWVWQLAKAGFSAAVAAYLVWFVTHSQQETQKIQGERLEAVGMSMHDHVKDTEEESERAKETRTQMIGLLRVICSNTATDSQRRRDCDLAGVK